jgi:hypothetical protein
MPPAGPEHGNSVGRFNRLIKACVTGRRCNQLFPYGVAARELDGADCFTVEEFGVGSEAEGFQQIGLHLL